MQKQIRNGTWRAIHGQLRVETRPWFCLKVVREIVENGMGWKPGDFYRRYWTHKVEENKTNEPWARDLERSLRNRGWAIPLAEARVGDLVFRYDVAKPYGHVGVIYDGGLIFENTPTTRGFGKGNLRLTPLAEWGVPTTIIRLREE